MKKKTAKMKSIMSNGEFYLLFEDPTGLGGHPYILSKAKNARKVWLTVFDGEREGEAMGFHPSELYSIFHEYFKANF